MLQSYATFSFIGEFKLYVESLITEKCTLLQPGDRFGVFLEEQPTAIGYIFEGSAPDALGYTLPNASVPTQIGEEVTFDPLVFPYKFSMAVYLFTSEPFSCQLKPGKFFR